MLTRRLATATATVALALIGSAAVPSVASAATVHNAAKVVPNGTSWTHTQPGGTSWTHVKPGGTSWTGTSWTGTSWT